MSIPQKIIYQSVVFIAEWHQPFFFSVILYSLFRMLYNIASFYGLLIENHFFCISIVQHSLLDKPSLAFRYTMNRVFGQQTTKVKQLVDMISHDIALGRYATDHALPSINRLSEDYQVSRDTVFKAFADLKQRGIIDSTPGKGYFVISRHKKILLLLDEYSPFKDTLYNTFVKRLSKHYKVDLWFHQYNGTLFNNLIRDAIGSYNYYVVMNFDNEKLSKSLFKIDPSKLLLLDFGKFDKKDYSFICQDFDESFYQALLTLVDRLRHYKRLMMLYPDGIKHPETSCKSFAQFCADQQIQGEVQRQYEMLSVEKDCAYLVFRQIDVVNIIKKSREAGLECGKDFGLIAYNDTPAYEVIDRKSVV